MKFQITARQFSKASIEHSLSLILNQPISIIRYTILKNGCYSVVYWLASNIKGSRIVSRNQVAKSALLRTVDAAKNVQFRFDRSTTTGWLATVNGCTCPAMVGDYALSIDGYAVCKHSIAYAKAFMGCSGLKAYMSLRTGEELVRKSA